MQYKNGGKWWSFTNDRKRFISLQLYDPGAKDYQLVDAYERHRQRFASSAGVVFVLRDEANVGQRVREVTMAGIEEYWAFQRSCQEDASEQEKEARERTSNT